MMIWGKCDWKIFIVAVMNTKDCICFSMPTSTHIYGNGKITQHRVKIHNSSISADTFTMQV